MAREVLGLFTLNTITGYIESATECLHSCGKLLDELQDVGEKAIALVEKALAALEASYKEEIECKYAVKTALRNLISIIEQDVPNFLDAVTDIFSDAGNSDMMAAAIDGVHATPPNLGPLRVLMRQLERSLKQAKESYHKIDSHCKATISSLTEAAEACAVKERASRNKKRTAKVAGGASSGGAIGMGVVAGGVAGTIATVGTVASIVVGIPTLGVGTIAGMTATAVSTAAFGAVAATAGVVGSVITHYIAKDFAEAESSFKKIREAYDMLLSCSDTVYRKVAKMESDMQNASMQVDHILSQCMDDDKCTDLLKTALSRLQKVCLESHDRASKLTTDLKDKLNSLQLHESL